MITSPSVSFYYLSIYDPQYAVQNGPEITVPRLVYEVGLRKPNAVGHCTRHAACTHGHWRWCDTPFSDFAMYHDTWRARKLTRGVHVNCYVAGRFTVTCRPSGTTLWCNVMECLRLAKRALTDTSLPSANSFIVTIRFWL